MSTENGNSPEYTARVEHVAGLAFGLRDTLADGTDLGLSPPMKMAAYLDDRANHYDVALADVVAYLDDQIKRMAATLAVLKAAA